MGKASGQLHRDKSRPAKLVSMQVWQQGSPTQCQLPPALLPAVEAGEGASRMEASGIPPGLGGCQLGRDMRQAAKRAVDAGKRELK